MKIIKEGKAPELHFICSVCDTEFEEDAKNCLYTRDDIASRWLTRCPICGSQVNARVD